MINYDPECGEDEIEADDKLGPGWGPERAHFLHRHAFTLFNIAAVAVYLYAVFIALT